MKISHLLSATALAGSLMLSAPAFAQASTPSGQTPTASECAADPGLVGCTNADGSPVQSGGDIVVTGSRIRLPNIDNLEPTVTVDQEYLAARNLTNVADALNEIPGFRGSVTPDGAQGSFGQGVNFINSFGLGSNRSLTLLNGRRVVSSNVATIFGNAAPGTQVDLNVIPSILVERIERVSIGGAPVYGSDAIAGTVNVILKERFEGIEGQATNSISEEGDNFRVNLAVAAGKNFADGRGNITIAGMYEKRDGMLAFDRDFLREGIGGQLNPSPALAGTLGPAGRSPLNDLRVNPNIGFDTGATDGFPGVVLVRRAGIPSLSRNGVIANIGALRPLDFNVQFDSNSNLIPYNRGILFGGAINSAASRSAGGDGFIFADFEQITSNIERYSASAFVTFDVSDNLRLFGEGLYYHGRSDELIQQNSFNSTLFSGVSGALRFSATNPFLSTQARNLLAANGYQQFLLSRINIDLADATGFSENDLYRGVIGAEYDFEAFGRDFNAQISANYGRNDFVDFGEQINQQNFVNAVNVATDSSGRVVCSIAGITAANTATPGFLPVADPNCAPLNLFGEGVASQAALDYVIVDTIARSRLEQFVVNANVGGSPFDLFGNPVGFNLGYEYREERATFIPDPFLQAGLGRSVAIAPNGGQYKLNEFFGEVLVPLFTPSNNFFLHSAEVYGRGRYVDNTVNGGFFAWAAGGRISPIRDVSFRGNYTKSFRAPSITELFSPVTNTFTTVPDLCSPSNRNAGPVPAIRSANCAAFLAAFPNATPLAAATATVPGRSGGNPNLANEEANSFTFGVIVQPRWVRGLSVSVDYLDIDISSPITSLTVAQIASGCFDNASFDTSDPANGNAFCSQIRRDSTGQVPADPLNPAVTSGFVNGQRIFFSGIQSTLDYSTRLSGLGIPGNFNVGGDLFYVRRRINDTTGIAPARSDGTLGDPEFQGQFRVRYSNDLWGVAGFVNYVGEQLTSRFNRGPSPNDTREFDQYDDYVTIDASAFVDVADNFRLNFSVTNLTNRVGQEYFGVIVPASINDRIGRRFAVSARFRY